MGTCFNCVCRSCLLWWSQRCPHGGCRDDWRAVHDPWPGPVRKGWTNWDAPGEQSHWCRGGALYPVNNCLEFIHYDSEETVVKDCLEGVIVKYQDGFIQCSLIDVFGCEECYRRFEERSDRD